MDILQEVTQSLKLIDELLLEAYQLPPTEYEKAEGKLPAEEYKRLMYVVNTRNKLQDDDEYSLSEKGLEAFRAQSQSLLLYLRTALKEKEERNKLIFKKSRLFNYKTHIQKWDEKISWATATMQGMFLMTGLLLLGGLTLFAYLLTDTNNIVLVATVIFLVILIKPLPEELTNSLGDKKLSKAFLLGNASLLLWRTLLYQIPLMLIGFCVYKYNHYWQDDMILLYFITLTLPIFISLASAGNWLTPKSSNDNYSQAATNE